MDADYQDSDESRRLFDELDRCDAVFVGSRGGCRGIITAMGVLRYLYEATSPFLLIAEIELSLRELINRVVESDELELFARTSLANCYELQKIPTKLVDMTFNDYVLLIGHGKNWGRFNRVFLADRNMTHAKLKQLADLRNNIFHFRRGLAQNDHDLLRDSRDWILRLVMRASDPAEWE